MRTILSTFLCVCVASMCLAQDETTCFLDASMNEVPSTSAAKYSRSCELTDGYYNVSVTYLDGSLKYTGSYLDPECTIEHGTFTYYYQNGLKESQGEFVKGIKSGNWQRWHWTGEERADRFYPGISVDDIRKRHETEPARFPGGEEAMWAFIKNNLEYPEQAKKQAIEGDVEIAFNIDSLGYINNVQIINSVNYFLDKEALRLIWLMPQWDPAKRRGEAVESKFIMPLTFRLAPLRKAN